MIWKIVWLVVLVLLYLALAGVDILLGLFGIIPIIGDVFNTVAETVAELLQAVVTFIIAILAYLLGVDNK